MLSSHLTSDSDDEDSSAGAGAPAAAVYENHSGGITDVLSGLKDDAEAQLDKARKAEQSALHNFEV